MKGMESGKDKVKKICDILRRETLEPAQREAEELIQAAKTTAESIVEEAEAKAKQIVEQARLDVEKQKAVFESSIGQACKQALETLKSDIETKLFNKELSHLLAHGLQEARPIAKLIEAVIRAIEKDGMQAELSVYVPAAVPAREVNAALSHAVLERLKEKSVLVGAMTGGIEVKLHGEKMTIDITAAALKELVAKYIRKDLRSLVFST